MFEKRETVNTTSYSDVELAMLKAFGIDANGYVSDSALKEATYFTCIKIMSESVAKIPCYLVQETEAGNIRMKGDSLYEKLALRPNPYMTAIDFWKALEINRHHLGDGCAFIEKDSKGNIINLWPVILTRLIIDDAGVISSKLKNKILVEYTQTGNSALNYCTYEDIIHLKSFSSNGINAKANKEMMAATIDTGIRSQTYLNDLYKNGLTNKAVVQLTSDLKDEKGLGKIQAKFERLYSNNGRIFTVPAGYSVSTLNLSLADAQFEQIRRMSISQIASSFGIKMFQLNDLSDTNNNSLEQQQLSFLVDTLLILFESIEQEIDWKLLRPDQRKKGMRCRFNTSVMLRTTAQVQADILTKYVTSGIYTPNEARLMTQQMAKDGADELVVNSGVMKLKDLGKDNGKEVK
jgi:HK97 family phage portal protein